MPQKISSVVLKCAFCAAVVSLSLVSEASADQFGTGDNQFDIDFVTISGATNPTSGYGIVKIDYRMGTYEITNDQWTKFKASLGVPVTGTPSDAYDESPSYLGASDPTDQVSWYEAAQFVNWLNTSTGHQAAYKFTGTQGQSDYTLAIWSTAEADNGTNLYRHKNAVYYLPTEDEWVKAGYWNGTSLQTYATKADETPYQGDGTSGTGWNFHHNEPPGRWAVGSGSEELNGTFDMMGNVWEWIESPFGDTSYGTSSARGLRGGAYYNDSLYLLASSFRNDSDPNIEYYGIGFRVASEVPEPATLSLLVIGGLALIRRRRKV